MYGYVLPDKEKIEKGEFGLFAAFYCGLCKCIGREYGQLPRFTTNYDMTFFTALIHDQTEQPVEFAKERCVGNPFAKRYLVKENPLLKRIAAINILLAYYKAMDGVTDKQQGAGTAARMLKKAYEKAKTAEPAAEEIVCRRCAELREKELAHEPRPDVAADSFAAMMRELSELLLGDRANPENLGLAYNVGKFVYLADALDDTGEDSRRGRYNPFLAAYGGYETREQFISDNKDSLRFIFAVTFNRAAECFNNMGCHQSYGLIRNIIYYGIRKKADELLNSRKKLKPPKL